MAKVKILALSKLSSENGEFIDHFFPVEVSKNSYVFSLDTCEKLRLTKGKSVDATEFVDRIGEWTYTTRSGSCAEDVEYRLKIDLHQAIASWLQHQAKQLSELVMNERMMITVAARANYFNGELESYLKLTPMSEINFDDGGYCTISFTGKEFKDFYYEALSVKPDEIGQTAKGYWYLSRIDGDREAMFRELYEVMTDHYKEEFEAAKINFERAANSHKAMTERDEDV